jgi:L-rhamnose-H+ transport protein
MSIFTGILFHATGAGCASMCYTPQRKTVGWSWQTYWMLQALVCWLLLPVIGAWLTIPHLSQVLHEAPRDAMVKSFGLGIAYGVGATAFGIAIRWVGFSLTYAISVGISCVLGTLLPPLVHGTLLDTLSKGGSGWIIGGIGIGTAGIALCGVAGRLKEKDLVRGKDLVPGRGRMQDNHPEPGVFSLAIGLPLCLLAGFLSAVYGFALDQGQPIADVAARYGAGNYQGNVIYIFSNGGAFLSTAVYCLYLHNRQKTFGQYRVLEVARKASALPVNFSMGFLTGLLWYCQFFFYGLGHTHMGNYKFTSWAIHMIMLVLFSSLVGLAVKEWVPCKPRTRNILGVALLVLIVAVLLLTYGNYLGGSGI